MIKNIDATVILRYDFTLNGYSLILSWWRDRPNETQQPALLKVYMHIIHFDD